MGRGISGGMENTEDFAALDEMIAMGEASANIGPDRESPFLQATLLRLMINLLKVHRTGVWDNDFFEPVNEVLTREEALGLLKRARATRPKNVRRRRADGRICVQDPPKEIARAAWADPETRESFRQLLLACLEEKRAQQERQADESKDVFAERFAELVKVFGLDALESDLLLLSYAVFVKLWMPYRMVGGRAARLRVLGAILNKPVCVIAAMLSDSGRLRRYECLDRDFDFRPALDAFLSGLSTEPLISRYFERFSGTALPWSMHGQLSEGHGEMLKTLLNTPRDSGGLHILFYGEPGVGKTAFAQTLAAELGRQLCVLKQCNEDEPAKRDSNCGFRFAALHLCDAQADPNGSLILIDEADDMLRGQANSLAMLFGEGPVGDKGVLNSVLDKIKTPCIWITNSDPEELAPSSRRRFDYSIRFDRLSRNQRCQVWKNAAQRYQLEHIVSDDVIKGLADRFGVSAGGIDLVLRNCAQIVRKQATSPSEAVALLEKLLKPHCELLGVATDASAFQVARDYSLDGLNVKGSVLPPRITEAVVRFRQRQSDGLGSGDVPRMNLLLYGPPGSGKTEYVKYLGRTLDCPVHARLGGDLLNKYVGGTERNIRAAFREAEAQRAILFIDEAEGMFRSRQMASQSWEVTQVNELLHAMENFSGVLVCATNAYESLDPATIRRFTFKLEFDYLTEAGKLLFYQRMFGGLYAAELSDAHRHRLIRIDQLTPGDFRTARQSLCYLDEKQVDHDHLLAALEGESQAKDQDRPRGRRIGFLE